MYEDLPNHNKIELQAFVSVALQAGYELAIDDGNGEFSAPSTDYAWLIDNLGEMDADEIKLHKGEHVCDGWFMLVYGNGPGELIADHTANEVCEGIYNIWAKKAGAE